MSQIYCHLLGNVQLTAPIDDPLIFSPHAQLIHLKLLPRTSTHPIRLLVITADRTGKYTHTRIYTYIRACTHVKKFH